MHSFLPKVFVALLATSLIQSASADDVPRGTLAVDKDLVLVGSRSQLSWDIKYPEKVTDIIDVKPPYVIKPKKDLTMRVRVLGASFQQDANTYLPVDVRWSRNYGSWTRIFYGRQDTVNPSKVVLETKVSANDQLNLAGRGYRNGWLPLYQTNSATPNLIMLKDGDKVPQTTPAFQQGKIETFLKPYLSLDGRTVRIGNRDLIILVELGQTNPANSGFDLQDLVLLVTFE
jgi:hypothetical protein